MGKLRKLFLALSAPCAGLFTFYQFPPPEVTDSTGLPLHYDPEQITNFWWQHKRNLLYRLLQVNVNLLPFIIRFNVARKFSSDWEEERSALYARELKRILVSLGPTYIKFGQVLSMRPDLVTNTFL